MRCSKIVAYCWSRRPANLGFIMRSFISMNRQLMLMLQTAALLAFALVIGIFVHSVIPLFGGLADRGPRRQGRSDAVAGSYVVRA